MERSRAIASVLFLAALFFTAKSQITFMDEPQDTQAVSGGSATFMCTVESEEEFEISWTFNGEGLQPGPKYNIPDDFTSLTITNIGDSDLGEYTCQVEDAGTGETIEASASLAFAVFDLTFSSQQPPTLSSPAGESITILCLHSNSNPAPTIVMMKDGSPLPTDTRFTIMPDSMTGPNGEMQHGIMLVINPTETTDSGAYQCTATNSFFPSMTATGPVTIVTISGEAVAPTITSPPLNQNVGQGESATLQCMASGTPSPTISWLKDNAQIESSSEVTIITTPGSSTLTILSVLASNLGDYTCTATNGGGSVNAVATVAFTVMEVMPVIVQSPQSVSVAVGGTAILMCGATGSPTPAITWQKDGATVVSSSFISIVSADGSSTLTITNAQMSDAGLYDCTATNTAGTTSSNAAITVNAGGTPVITQHPMSITATEGTSVSLTCAASGSPTITWQKDGVTVVSSPTVTITTSGDTSTLTLSSVTSTDAGSYDCMASNAQGNAQSNPATLTIESAGTSPRILVPPQTITAGVGQEATLSCSANGDPIPSIQWFFNGVDELVTNADLTVTSMSGSSTLTIHSVQMSNAGIYECRAVNSAGSDSGVANIMVTTSPVPSFTQHPTSSTVSVGSQAIFTCAASGSSTMAWQKDGVEVSPSATVTIVSSGGLSTLTLSSVTSTDAGSYTCSATNAEGTATSNPATLTIESAGTSPTIQVPPQTITVGVGQEATLSCSASGDPIPSIQWFFNGVDELVTNADLTVTSMSGSSTLTIHSVQMSNAGLYECRAVNSAGSDSGVANIMVTTSPLPSFTQHPTSSTVSVGSQATFTCAASGSSTMAWQKDGVEVSPSATVTIVSSGGMSTLTLSSVTNTDAGSYTCSATNAEGTATSNPATLTIESAGTSPTIQVPPQTITVGVGQEAQLSCSASGDPIPSIQWFFNGVNELVTNADLTVTSMSGSSTLTIHSVEMSNAGLYECRAVNSAGSDSAIANIMVTTNPPPSFTQHPTSSTVSVGSQATFTCAASGSSTMAWQKDGVEVSPSATVTIVSSGGMSTLTLSSVTSTDAGSYTCSATNAEGTATSNPATLTVNTATIDLAFQMEPSDTFGVLGQAGLINCQPPNSVPPAVVQWLKDSSPITDSRFTVASNGSLLISSVMSNDAGQYVCTATNQVLDITRTSGAAQFQVFVVPAITQSPQSVSIGIGGSFTLTCSASGSPAPSFTWSKDGSTLANDGAHIVINGGSVTVSNVVQSDVGTYTCVASNSVGSAQANALVAILSPPSFTLTSDTVSAIVGSSVVLPCHATPDPSLSFSWLLAGVPLPQQQVLSNGGLSIGSVAESNEGTYTCVATNTLGSAQGTVQLTVNAPPTAVAAQSSVTATEGQTAQLVCTVTGDPNPTVTWQSGGVTIPNPNTATITTQNSGAILVFNPVQLSNAGSYQCTASNGVGSPASATVTLSVLTMPFPPTVSLTPAVSLTQGDSFTLNCQPTGNPAPTVSWTKDGVTISSSTPRITVTGGVVTITGATLVEAGLYRCQAQNSLGSATATTSITVNVPPQLTLSTPDLTTDEGTTTVLNCQATGSPTPVITWSRNGAIFPNIASPRATVAPNNSLIITGTQQGDAGDYVCQASNTAGTVSYTVSLSVNSIFSTFIDSPGSSTALTGQPLTLSCLLHNNPPLPPTVQWTKNNVTLSSSNRVQITYSSSTGSAQYHITSVLYADAGEYHCVALDGQGETLFTSAPGTLTVQGIPAFAALLQSQSVSITSTAQFVCNVLSNPTATVSWTFNGAQISNSDKYTIASSSLTISNVQMSDDGYYRCQAVNSFGTNQTIAKLTVTEPINLPVVSITEGTTASIMAGVLVTLHCTVTGGEISSIQWRKATSGGSTVVSDGVSLSSTGATLTFPSIAMTDGGNYQCVANNSAGSSSAGIQLNVNVAPQLQLSVTTLTYDVGQVLPVDQGPLCTAVAGSPEPDIVWTGPSGSQEASNNGRLVITGILQQSNGGAYTCRAINVAGVDTATFTLVVNTGPMIIVSPEDRDITQGENVLLPCIAQGKPFPTIQWSKTQGQLPNGAVTSLFGLQLYSVSMTDGGTYQCTATNQVTAISSFASVVVHAPPLVDSITPNERQYMLTGSTFTITCTVTASPSINVRWYHNSSLLSATSDGRIRFMGDQLRTLSISNTVTSDSGSYVCNVSSTVNFDTASLMVTVGTNPSIVTPPPNVDLVPGDSFFLPCVATGVPLPTTSWSRTTETGEEQQLELIGPNYHIETQGLRINSAQRDDTGRYHCTADNRVATTMFSSSVRVEGAPQATNITPTVMTVSQPATLTCHILYGYPNPSFTWRRAGGTLVAPDRTFVNGNGQLVFTTVQEGDAGDYECVPNNQYGGTGFTQSISVWVLPNITFPENPVTGVLDDAIVLKCPATGSPTPSVSWRLPNGNTPPGNPTELTLGPSLSLANEGNYTCVAENSAGSMNKSVELQIRGAAPSTININIISSTSLFIFWTPPVPGNQLQSYNVSYGVADLPERTSRMELTTFLSLFNLEEFSVYEFTIRGMFFNGVEGLPIVGTGTTLEALPSGSPRNLELISYIEAFEIRWQLPRRFDQNGVIRGFLIDYRVTPVNNASNTTFTNQLNITVNSTDTLDTVYQHNLTGLIGDESYDVRILAYNTLGLGPHSDITSIRTQQPFPLGLVLGVSISVGAVVLAVILVLLVIFFIWVTIRCIKARQFSPADTEKGRPRSKKRRTKADVSEPHPEIPPDVDDKGRSGKFTIQRKDGSSMSSQPRVITKSDVARKRKTGATVVSRHDSVIKDDYEPYEVPVDTIKPKGGKTKKVTKKYKGDEDDTQPLTNSRPSIYDDDIDPYATTHPVIPPSKPDKPDKKEEQDEAEIEDLPVELPVRLEDLANEEPVRLEDLAQEDAAEEPESEEEEDQQPEQQQQQEEEEEEDWGDDAWEKEYRRRSRVQDDDEDQPYATVSQDHVEKKRSKKLKEQMKDEKQKRKEEEKLAAAKKKQQQKARKEAEKKQKKAMKERQKRASLGLDNNLSLSQLGYGAGGRGFDSAAATMF